MRWMKSHILTSHLIVLYPVIENNSSWNQCLYFEESIVTLKGVSRIRDLLKKRTGHDFSNNIITKIVYTRKKKKEKTQREIAQALSKGLHYA